MVLKNINPLISPDLLYQLYIMGHGDEILFADAHFPGHSLNKNIIRCDGIKIPDLLEAILPLFEIDSYSKESIIMMDAVQGDTLDPNVEKKYMSVISKFFKETTPTKLERFKFYEKSKNCFCVVMTGDIAKYGNIILKKGVTPF
jgi:L-fucose mutarotase